MAGKYDSHLKLFLFGCAGMAGLGGFIAVAGADFGFILMILSMGIATPAIFHCAMQWPLKDGEKKRKSEKEAEK